MTGFNDMAGGPVPRYAGPPAEGYDCARCTALEEADHRIANHLNLLSSAVQLRSKALGRRDAMLSPTEMRLILEAIVVQIDSVARIHRAMAGGTPAVSGVRDLIHDICCAFAVICSERLELIEDLAYDRTIEARHVPTISQIVSELITNAAKYAGSETSAGRITVRTRSEIDWAIAVEVEDNGPGLPPDWDTARHDGLGLRLIRALSLQLGATVSFDKSDPGLCVRLLLPEAVAA